MLLGKYESWKHEAVPTKAGDRVASYVIPSRTGKVSVTCTAAAGAASSTLALCERTASTLRLGPQKTMTLEAVTKTQEHWRQAANRLRIDRAAGRRELARANLQADQIQAAQGLAGTYEHAARRFAAISNGEPVVKAARETAATYRALAEAAQVNTTSSWAAAVAEVRAAEARLARAVAAG
jgi:hypothetical protein